MTGVSSKPAPNQLGSGQHAKSEDALSYADQVKSCFKDEPGIIPLILSRGLSGSRSCSTDVSISCNDADNFFSLATVLRAQR